MATPEEIRALIDRYIVCFSEGRRDEWLELWAPDATMDDPLGDVKQGRDEIAAFFDLANSMAESIVISVNGLVKIVGNEAAWVARIVNTIGGNEVAIDAIETWVVNDEGKLQTMRAYWSFADMAL